MTTQSLGDQLAAQMAEVRRTPADASARMRLFRLFCVTGEWPRAMTQLDTASSLDATLAMSSLHYKQAIACERLREAVFAGDRQPLLLGDPRPWQAWLVEALRSEPGRATSLRVQALEAADTAAGLLNDRPFEWLGDADPRIGPHCEAFIDGKYFWLAFDRLAAIRFTEPDDMLDLVWIPAEVELRNGGTRPALIPVRYPGSESASDDAIRLARRTDWLGTPGGSEVDYRGLGQRTWTTDAEEVGILDVRSLVVGPSSG